MDSILVLLFLHDLIGVTWEIFKKSDDTDIELNGRDRSESEFPIQEVEDACRLHPEIDGVSSDFTFVSDNENMPAERFTTALALTTVRLCFSRSWTELNVDLRTNFPGPDAVFAILALGSQQFDVAVSEAGRNLLMSSDSFDTLPTRLTIDDPLIIEFGELHAFSQMLATYMMAVPIKKATAWFASNISDLKGRLTQSIESALLEDGFVEHLRLTIQSSSKSQDIYVGLLSFFVDHTHLLHGWPAVLFKVQKNNQSITLNFNVAKYGDLSIEVLWSMAFSLPDMGILLSEAVYPRAASVLAT